MKKSLPLMLTLLLLTVATQAQTAKLSVEQNGSVTLTSDIGDVQRIDLTGTKAISVIAKDGTELATSLSKAGLKLNFTDDVPTAVKAVEAATVNEKKTVRKRLVNGQLIIETPDGKSYNTAGGRLK